jgi:hypothetical protein
MVRDDADERGSCMGGYAGLTDGHRETRALTHAGVLSAAIASDLCCTLPNLSKVNSNHLY